MTEAPTSFDLAEVATWPDLITDPGEARSRYGVFVTDAVERLALVEQMEQLVEGTVNRMEEGMAAVLDYTDESLDGLETIIGPGFAQASDEEMPMLEALEELVTDLGAYLGLVIIENLGGEWRFRADIWHASIFFPSAGAECFPFHRVARRLVNGPVDSLAGFYTGLIDVLEAGH